MKLKINCSFSAMVAIAELKPHPLNPNKHPKKQIAAFEKILEFQGIRRPAIVSRRSGFIVSGHGLVLAAKQLGLLELPVDYQEFESQDAELAHLNADNELARLSETDEGALEKMISEMSEDFDKELAGILKEEDKGEAEPPKDYDISTDQYMILVTCRDELQQTELLDQFEKNGLTCKALIS